MSRLAPTTALALALVFAAAALVACGDSETNSSDAADTATALDTSVAADTAEPGDGTTAEDADASDVSDTSDAAADAADTADTAAPACRDASDCTWCTYPSAPVFESDCYCPLCPSTVLAGATCEANATAWTDVCSAWAVSCPVADCAAPPNEPACLDGLCTDPCALVDCARPDCPESEWVREPGQCCPTCRDPRACDETADCGWCTYDKPVESQADCYCRACPTFPLDAGVCAEYAAQWANNCPDGWDAASPCPIPRCAMPHEVACDPATSTCVDACSITECPQLDCEVADQILDPGACCPRCKPRIDACDDAGDCQRCVYKKPVLSVDDCYCTICPSTPTTTAQCELWGDQWQATCAGSWRDDNPCPIPMCLLPEPVACDEGGSCVGCGDIVCPELDCPVSSQFTPEGACCATCAPPVEPCAGDDSCSWCTYPRGVASEAECYCPICPSFGVTTAQCQVFASEWQTHCGGSWYSENPCPIAMCLPHAPPLCDESGACVADPNACGSSFDCTRCPYAVAPTSSSDCQCQGCGTPMTTTACDVITAAVEEHCSNGELDDCVPPPCAFPPPLVCGADNQCANGPFEIDVPR